MWRDFMDYGRSPKRFAGYFPIRSWRELAPRYRACRQIKYFIDLTGETFHSLRVKLPLARTGAARISCALGSIPASVIVLVTRFVAVSITDTLFERAFAT